MRETGKDFLAFGETLGLIVIADLFSLVEIADTTLTYDLETKRRVYAEAGIPEYWVISIANRQLIVFRDGKRVIF